MIMKDDHNIQIDTQYYKYATGQPMGALSSWAMLAITHHYLVQIAFTMAHPEMGRGWYTDYEILGDDIVIFDKLAADSYLSLMRLVGVDINLSKSVVSNNGSFEFAKNTYHQGRNVSGVSWKMFMSQRSLIGRVNIAFHLIDTIKPKYITTYFKSITKYRPNNGGNYNFSVVSLLTMFANKEKITYTNLLKLMTSVISSSRHFVADTLDNLNLTLLERIYSSLFKGTTYTLPGNVMIEKIFKQDSI